MVKEAAKSDFLGEKRQAVTEVTKWIPCWYP
jgi:hypothetical protein